MQRDPGWELPAATIQEFRPKQTKYAVIIPIINEGERIRVQLQRMQSLIPLADIVIVDGGSKDGSNDPTFLSSQNVRTLIIKTGPGKLSAQLRLGLAYGLEQDYEGVILIDGNNKDDPDAIPLFIDALDKGYDHVQGSRFVPGGKAENNPASRLLGIKLLHAPLISLAARFRYTDTTNGFRAYSRKLLVHPGVKPFRDIFSAYELHYYLAIRAGRLGMRITEVPVTRSYPPGEIPTKISKYRGNALILQTLFKACTHQFDPQKE